MAWSSSTNDAKLTRMLTGWPPGVCNSIAV
jgi:hypothetical protein